MADRGRPASRLVSIRVLPASPAPFPEAPPRPAAEGAERGRDAEDGRPERGAALDSCARLHWDRGGRLGSYRACGTTGFFAGFFLVLAMASITGIPRLVALVVVITVPV